MHTSLAEVEERIPHERIKLKGFSIACNCLVDIPVSSP